MELSEFSTKLESIMKMPSNDNKQKDKLLNQMSDELEKSLDPNLPMTMFLKAQVLEQLASVKQSNNILERAIHFYREIMYSAESVSDDLLKQAGDKCIKLMQFRGWNSYSVRIWQILIGRFPTNFEYQRQLGVTYLTIGNDESAKKVFEELVHLNQDSFAKAHLGFVLKSEAVSKNDKDQLQKSVELMEEAIMDENQTLEGLFYFHLGDGFRRLNLPEKADKIFQLGADRQIFISFWQRSLYNEPGLKSQPIWPLKETGIEVQLQKFKTNWKSIRDEALKVYDSTSGGFINESESLKDTGYWGQFDLFIQGREKVQNCAKAPITCSLVKNIPEIKNNRRGQVKFSVMKSGTHVHPHSGPTNCRLRAHLGLKVPVNKNQNNTVLRVADNYLHWSDGEIFVFDDSFDHEVWHSNENNEARIVLIMDLWHPQLSAEKRASLPAI